MTVCTVSLEGQEAELATSIVMPQLGYDMREGTVVRWIKQEGDEVVANEVIAEIETDKAVVEFKPTTGGVLRRIVAGEGEAVPVGQLIAVIGDADEALPDNLGGPATGPAPAAEPPAAPAAEPAPAPSDAAAPAGEVRASPIARRLARDQGVDLALVTGTGPWRPHRGGRRTFRCRSRPYRRGGWSNHGVAVGSPAGTGAGTRPSRDHRHRAWWPGS